MAAVAELDASLSALLSLKPPGVTKGRISSITQLCVENVKSESVIIQKIFTHFKRTPATHKLGVLYAVDSIARQWIEKAGASGQDLRSSNAQDGTYAAGVNHVSELLPAMMSDLIAQAPEDQMEKINKLVDIWERGNTFPTQMTSEFKSKLTSRPVKQPSPELEKPADDGTPAQSEPPAPAAPAAPPQMSQLSQLPSALPQTNAQSQIQPPTPAAAPAAQPQGAVASQDGLNALAKVLPPSALSDPQKMAHYLQVLQQLVSLGVPSEQWGDVIKALHDQQSGVPQAASQITPAQVATAAPATQQPSAPPAFSGQEHRSQNRDRSRSPTRRGSPGYGARGQNPYRQRSPRRSFSPPNGAGNFPQNAAPKWLEYDPSLPPNNIKVLSRTLFVGGTTCPEKELREVFARFGTVQSVICNPQKRHAFVKMYTRTESLRAKTAMDTTEDPSILSRARSTKWGVGFGPRECCDYAEGVSTIPIDRLTDADRRWILTAEYGGNGGKEITHGQVMEEPDIEIGAGVSSKAISLRVGAGQKGKQQQRGGGGHRNRDRDRDRDRDHHGNFHRGPPPGYNPNPFPPMGNDPGYGPPPQEAMPPMGVPPPMPSFNFPPPPQGGFSMFPQGMPPFPMK